MPTKRPSPARLILALGSIVFVGCADVTRAPSSPEQPYVSRSGSVQIENLDDQFSRVASEAPSFAGLHLGEGGDLVIAATNLSDTTALVRVIESLEPTLLYPSGTTAASPSRRFIQARHSFAELRSRKAQLLSVARGLSLTLVDIDEVRNVVRLGVMDASARNILVSRIMDAGIPSTAVLLEIIPRGVPHQSVVSRFRPFPGGVKTSLPNNNWCTVGAIVHTGTGSHGFITSSHCTTYFGVVNGDFFYQSDTGITNLAGYEAYDLPTWDCQHLSYSDPCRYSDAAFVAVDSADVELGFVIRTQHADGLYKMFMDTSNPRFTHLTPPFGTMLTGTTIHKMGATTGWTSGTVQSTCVDVPGWGPLGGGAYVTLLCQYLGSYDATGGDSGAPVFTRSGTSDVYLRGVHAGYLYDDVVFSRWNYIEMEYSEDLGSLTVTAP